MTDVIKDVRLALERQLPGVIITSWKARALPHPDGQCRRWGGAVIEIHASCACESSKVALDTATVSALNSIANSYGVELVLDFRYPSQPPIQYE